MKNFSYLFIFFIVISCRQQTDKLDMLIPQPLSVEKGKGCFTFCPATAVFVDSSFADLEEYFIKAIETLTPLSSSPAINYVYILRNKEKDSLGEEGYFLSINKTKITLRANDRKGAFYGMQTLLQLISAEPVLVVPCGIIVDKPRYAWRGFMLDVARQFYPEEVILKLIDALAFYKINVLHLHLSDDQGWRIEIEGYPELTRVGAIANKAFGDKSSGFYSKNTMRKIIQYASFRNITIVPEIDMPGHSRAAITAYPWLSCFGGPGRFDKTNPRDNLPFYDPVCPGNSKTYAFYQTVLGEIAALFPGEYIHVGGDEVSGTCWKSCSRCQALMKKEKLKDVNALQSYFAQKIQKIIESYGKKAIGWDELYERGIPASFSVMAWREEQWGIEAANAGHKVVFSPCQYYYFNYSQVADEERRYAVASPMYRVYTHRLAMGKISSAKHQNVMGMEACFWGGHDSTGTALFEAVFPRLIALAEKAWSRETEDYNAFLHRLGHHYPLLDQMNIPYYVPHPEGLYDDVCLTKEYEVNLTLPPLPGAEIHYTLNGSEPDRLSALYTTPFKVPVGTVIRARTVLSNGRMSIPVTGTSRKVSLLPAVKVDRLAAGVRTAIYKGKITTLRDMPLMTKIADTIMSGLFCPYDSLKKNFGLSFTGFLSIPADGVYSFYLNSCDGSNLFLHGDTIVSNDYCHPRLTIVRRVALAKGMHPFRVDYFYSSIFEKHFVVEVAGPGLPRTEIPAGMLFH